MFFHRTTEGSSMKIQVTTGDIEKATSAKHAFSEPLTAKFVLAHQEDDEYLLVCEQYHCSPRSHYEIACMLKEAGYQVLGGGRIVIHPDSGVVAKEWGSFSMADKLGYDRPTDDEYTLLDTLQRCLTRQMLA